MCAETTRPELSRWRPPCCKSATSRSPARRSSWCGAFSRFAGFSERRVNFTLTWDGLDGEHGAFCDEDPADTVDDMEVCGHFIPISTLHSARSTNRNATPCDRRDSTLRPTGAIAPLQMSPRQATGVTRTSHCRCGSTQCVHSGPGRTMAEPMAAWQAQAGTPAGPGSKLQPPVAPAGAGAVCYTPLIQYATTAMLNHPWAQPYATAVSGLNGMLWPLLFSNAT